MDGSTLRVKAGRVAPRAEFRDIRLTRSTFELDKIPQAGVLMYDLDTQAEVERDDDGAWFVVNVSFSLKILESRDRDSAADDPDVTVARMDFAFASLYSIHLDGLDSELEFEEFQAFALTTGLFAVHPYAREYVRDVTGRLAIPPLNLGLLHWPMEKVET